MNLLKFSPPRYWLRRRYLQLLQHNAVLAVPLAKRRMRPAGVSLRHPFSNHRMPARRGEWCCAVTCV